MGNSGNRRDRAIRWYAVPVAAIGAAISIYHYVLEWNPSLEGGACELTGPVSTLIEWDDEIPDWPVLAAEAEKARAARDATLGVATSPGALPDADGSPVSVVGRHLLHPGSANHGGPRELAALEDNSLGAAVAE